MNKTLFLLTLLLAFFASVPLPIEAQIDKIIKDGQVTVVDRTGIRTEEENPVAFGKRVFFEAIKTVGGTLELYKHWTQTQRKTYIVIGTTSNRVVSRLLANEMNLSKNNSEGVIYQWCNSAQGMVLVIAGTDEKGLMYALTELAQRVLDKGLEALLEVENTVQFPDNAVRGLDKFLTDYNDDSWFFSEDYWQYYIQHLASNRFNRLALITGYKDGTNDGFMVPAYPFIVKVPGYEDLKISGKVQKKPEQYLAQIRRIGQICHAHGLDFVFGIWNHGVKERMVAGLPSDTQEYTEYCTEGMRILLREIPEIDGLQLRINYEAGVGGFGETAEMFWKDIIGAIGDIYHERNGRLFLDLRAKGLTYNLRQWALETGIDLHVATKFTWEGTGLPFHPTQMRHAELELLDNMDKRQRYGYADFMNKSRDFDVIFRLWGVGTNRLFTWADPDYAQRFSQSVGFGGSRGFQVTPPLSTKINTWPLFEDNGLVHYEWEDERYWAWYLVFGRLGYSSETKPDVWQRAFRAHYGKAASAMEAAYRAAGKILPLITSAHLTAHPGVFNWAEMETGGALFGEHNFNRVHKKRTYQSAEPGDPGLFYIIEDYVLDFQDGTMEGKITPVQLAALYSQMGQEIRSALVHAEAIGVQEMHQIEYQNSRLDLLLSADLAEFHELKTRAATDLVFYQKTKKSHYLRAALGSMRNALQCWKIIIERTSNSYQQNVRFMHYNGSWVDRIKEIEQDVAKLEEMLIGVKDGPTKSHWNDIEVPASLGQMTNVVASIPDTAKADKPLKIYLKVGEWPRDWGGRITLHYRRANMTEGPFKTMTMQWNGKELHAEIPGTYLVSEYDLLLYFTAINDYNQTLMHPGLFHPIHPAPYYIIEID
jgi:hypothetical protein